MMEISSFLFWILIFGAMILYYILPKKIRWTVLLAASILFYAAVSPAGLPFVLVTAVTIYAATVGMDALRGKRKAYLREHKEDLSKEEKTLYKARTKKMLKRIMIGTVLCNIGLLCVFKYAHFAVDQINALSGLFGGGRIGNGFKLPAVLGISFYTFQSVGYLVDVYWERVPAQKNFFKTLLFVSFFPQVTQGPISEYGQLGDQLFEGHAFSYDNFSRGFQRMLWGYAKKLCIADLLAPVVSTVFAGYATTSGVVCLVGAFCYSIQIYMDFSGYMDIMCGVCEMFGIKLAENFERPYFSKSIAEYWRRWHITLGAWFKKYIYYPIGVSRWNRAVGKRAKAKLGKHVGETLPASLALVVVWLATGLWHGASWAYIAWGGVNGVFIIFSLWMEPVYDRVKLKLRVREGNFFWRAFQVVRTFILVTFIKVLPEVGTLRDGLGLFRRIFTDRTLPDGVFGLFPGAVNRIDLCIAFGLTAVVFLFSLRQRKRPVRDGFGKLPMPVRVLILSVLFVGTVLFGLRAASAGGFMYAGF